MTKALRLHEREREKEREREAGELVPHRAAFPELPRLMERLDELFNVGWRPFWPMLRTTEELLAGAPPVDVYEEGNEVVVKAELPGMKREEIEVRAGANELTLAGRRERTEKIERKDYHRYERAAGAFTRTVTLPAEIELEKVTARYVDGVLEIRAPKAAPAKVTERKVEVA